MKEGRPLGRDTAQGRSAIRRRGAATGRRGAATGRRGATTGRRGAATPTVERAERVRQGLCVEIKFLYRMQEG